MVVSFFGHAQFHRNDKYEQEILHYLSENIGDQYAEVYFGGYGGFDLFAYECCKKYKATHPNISLVFVSPYTTVEYQRNHLDHQKARYDSILYPGLENIPPRFAIVYRNRYIVEKSDYIMFYVSHDWGGAYATYQYAMKRNKCIYNLANFKDDNIKHKFHKG